MNRWLIDLIRYRDLLVMLTWRDIRIKYKQSIMGFLWAILMPLFIIAAGVMVKLAYAHVTKVPLEMAQVLTVSVKALPWAFFISALRFATNSLTSNSNLVTKIYFPKDIFPISAVLSQLFDFFIAAVFLAVLLAVAQIGLTVHLLWVPVLIALLGLFVTGLGILLSAANLFFRDVKYLVEVFVTFGVFFTPVFYEASLFGDRSWILLLNPVAVILEGLNDSIVLHQTPDLGWVTYTCVIAGAVFTSAVLVFKRLEPLFAESI
jgi:lipopolysaccharide transport system permease protein